MELVSLQQRNETVRKIMKKGFSKQQAVKIYKANLSHEENKLRYTFYLTKKGLGSIETHTRSVGTDKIDLSSPQKFIVSSKHNNLHADLSYRATAIVNTRDSLQYQEYLRNRPLPPVPSDVVLTKRRFPTTVVVPQFSISKDNDHMFENIEVIPRTIESQICLAEPKLIARVEEIICQRERVSEACGTSKEEPVNGQEEERANNPPQLDSIVTPTDECSAHPLPRPLHRPVLLKPLRLTSSTSPYITELAATTVNNVVKEEVSRPSNGNNRGGPRCGSTLPSGDVKEDIVSQQAVVPRIYISRQTLQMPPPPPPPPPSQQQYYEPKRNDEHQSPHTYGANQCPPVPVVPHLTQLQQQQPQQQYSAYFPPEMRFNRQLNDMHRAQSWTVSSHHQQSQCPHYDGPSYYSAGRRERTGYVQAAVNRVESNLPRHHMQQQQYPAVAQSEVQYDARCYVNQQSRHVFPEMNYQFQQQSNQSRYRRVQNQQQHQQEHHHIRRPVRINSDYGFASYASHLRPVVTTTPAIASTIASHAPAAVIRREVNGGGEPRRQVSFVVPPPQRDSSTLSDYPMYTYDTQKRSTAIDGQKVKSEHTLKAIRTSSNIWNLDVL